MTTDIEQLKHRARQRLRSTFAISGFEDDKVFIVDLDGLCSVTNDAEQVVRFLNISHPNKRVIYRDSAGDWGELRHTGGVFIGFQAHSEPACLSKLSKLAKLGCVEAAAIAGRNNNWITAEF